MSYELHKNAIITGCLNSFCLACDRFFESMQEAHSHVGTPSHSLNLARVPYSANLTDHNIRKFKIGYFCEFCNVLLPTIMKVNLHIAENDHFQNRGNTLLKSTVHGVVAFDSVLIQEVAWHALKEGICSICDIEYDDEDFHKIDNAHTLKLIQNPIKFDANGAIYRQIDGANVQCLTCNVLLPLSAVSKHFDDVEHLNNYAKCKTEANNVNNDCQQLKETTENHNENSTNPQPMLKRSVKQDHESKLKILQSLTTYQSNDIEINFETDRSYCKKCRIDINFDVDDIEKHIKKHSEIANKTNTKKNNKAVKHDVSTTDEHSDIVKDAANTDSDVEKDTVPDVSEDDNSEEDYVASSATNKKYEENLEINNSECFSMDAKSFAKDNNITYNEENNNAFCRICRVKLPATLKSMKEHTKGTVHIKKVKIGTKLAQPQKKRIPKLTKMKGFITSMWRKEGMFQRDVCINEEYCISESSFLLLQKTSWGYQCLLCQTNIVGSAENFRDHIHKSAHQKLMGNLRVVTSGVKDKEFIREVKPDVYHCGFCNCLVQGWSQMESHLESSDHEEHRFEQLFHIGVSLGILPPPICFQF